MPVRCEGQHIIPAGCVSSRPTLVYFYDRGGYRGSPVDASWAVTFLRHGGVLCTASCGNYLQKLWRLRNFCWAFSGEHVPCPCNLSLRPAVGG